MGFNRLYRDVLDGLKARYGDRLLSVVLFGSRFQGRAKAHSDLDVLVLLSEVEDEDRYARAALEEVMVRYVMPMDVLVFTWDEFCFMVEQRFPLVLGVLLGYEVIYDKVGVSKLLSDADESLRREGWRRYRWSGIWVEPKRRTS